MLMYHVGCGCLWSISETKRFYPVNIPSYFLHRRTLGPWCFCTTENKSWGCRFQHIFLLLEWVSSSKSRIAGPQDFAYIWMHSYCDTSRLVATWGDSWLLISVPHHLTYCQTARPLGVKEVLVCQYLACLGESLLNFAHIGAQCLPTFPSYWRAYVIYLFEFFQGMGCSMDLRRAN